MLFLSLRHLAKFKLKETGQLSVYSPGRKALSGVRGWYTGYPFYFSLRLQYTSVIFNIGKGENISINRLAELIIRLMGTGNIELIHQEPRLGYKA